MKSRLPLLVLPALLGSCLIPDLGISAHAAYMKLEPSGNLALADSAGSNPLDAVRIDLEDGFDLDGAETPVLGARVQFKSWEIAVSAFHYDESSSSVLTRDFGGISASPGSPTPVQSDLEILNVNAVVAIPVIDLDYLDLSVGIMVDYFDVGMEVRSASAFEDLSFTAPAPMLYVRASTDVSIVAGILEVGWLDIDLGDASGSYFDLNAMISVAVLPKVDIVVGYRNIVIDADGEVDDQGFGTHLHMSGWYIGGGITF